VWIGGEWNGKEGADFGIVEGRRRKRQGSGGERVE